MHQLMDQIRNDPYRFHPYSMNTNIFIDDRVIKIALEISQGHFLLPKSLKKLFALDFITSSIPRDFY